MVLKIKITSKISINIYHIGYRIPCLLENCPYTAQGIIHTYLLTDKENPRSSIFILYSFLIYIQINKTIWAHVTALLLTNIEMRWLNLHDSYEALHLLQEGGLEVVDGIVDGLHRDT